ncbi:unnamed protein product [Fraxinus pennsylvanica]|uniref:Uncharacterized protein n=1 Tax=Fraxinus pennsylvanica TaxID=56036 RepID=A0AAD2E3E0_9LAMI|nr:unnamed protein product [Fraxinus pennsylvanica]
MESNHKRRGFVKAKMIMSLYQTKRKTPAKELIFPQQMQYQIKQKAPPQADSVGFIVKPEQVFPQKMHQAKQTAQPSVGFIVNQDQVFPQQMQKGSIVVPERGQDSYGKLDNFYGVAGDDGVDAKAASYISVVRERLSLQHVNSERKTYEDIYSSEDK